MPIDYSKYPANWKTEIRPAILKRAGNRCERCKVPNYMYGSRNEKGEFLPAMQDEIDSREDICGRKVFRVILTVAHLNHDVTDNRPENLAALCQKCHLTHDKEQHKATRQKNRFRDQPELFEEKG